MHLEGIVNSINVFLGYFLLIVMLPSFTIKPIVKNENIFKKFIIYLVFGNFYISSIVFILAYMGIFTRSSLIASIVILSIGIRSFIDRNEIKDRALRMRQSFDDLVLGKYGWKIFIYDKFNAIKKRSNNFFYEIINGKKLEWIIFIAIIAYNVYQYGINNFKFITYIAPDEEVHVYWIQSLIGGKIFPSGIYPHVFHNVMASIIEVFGFTGVIFLRYFGATSCILIMSMLYLGLRKIFGTKYPALFGLLMYSIINIYSVDATFRFQFVIPQEYAMIMLMPIAIFLLDYIRDRKPIDLIFWMLSLSLSMGIHFYTGIIGIILTFSILTVYLYKIIKQRIVLKLIIAGVISLIVAIAPLATGLVLGYEMEQSMSWATEVIKGDIYKSDSEDTEVIEVEETEEVEELTWDEFKRVARKDMKKFVVEDIKNIYVFAIIIIITLIFNLILVIFKKNKKESAYKIAFALNALILIILMLLRALKLPTIMETRRVVIFFAYFSPIWIGIPLDTLIKFFKGDKGKKIIPILSVGAMVLGIYLVLNFNMLRPIPPFYYFQTTGTMKVNMKIIEDYQDYTWTAVSPVNNISSVLNHGFHYELSDFIKLQENWDNEKEIRIPTEYVFIYIEKRPILDLNFGNRFYPKDAEIINRRKIRKKDAYKEFSNDNKANFIYENERHILMAKAYYWAQEYEKYFKNEMDVYYEDQELIVYRVRQNVYAINNFSIDYGMNKK